MQPSNIHADSLLDENGLFNRRAVQLLVGSAVGMLGGFVVFFPLLLGVFIKPIEEDMGWSRAQTSLLITMSYLGMTIAAPFLSIIIRRFGPRRALIIGYGVLILCLASFAVLPGSLPLYGVTCLVAGLGATITTPGGLILIVSNSFDRRLGLALGCAMTGLGIGAFSLPILAERLIDMIGWRSTYLVMAGMVGVLAVVSLSLIFNVIDPHGRADEASGETVSVSKEMAFSEILSSWRFWIIGSALLATTLAASGAAGHIPAALAERGLSAQEAALGAGLIGIGIFLGRLGAAILMDVFYAPLVVLGCFMLGAVGFQAAVHVSVEMKVVLLIGVVMIGLVTGSDGDIGPILSRRYFGPDAFKRVFGILFALWGLGAIIGPWLAGLSRDATGGYDQFFNIASVLCLMSGIVIMFLGKYRYAPKSEEKPAGCQTRDIPNATAAATEVRG